MKTTRKKKRVSSKDNPKKEDKSYIRIDKFIKYLFVSSIILVIWEIIIFRETIISSTPLLITMTIIALITTPFTFKFLYKNDADLKLPDSENKYHKFNKKPLIIIICYFFLNWIVCGGLPITTFILSNYYFAERASTKVTVKVTKIGELNGRYNTNYAEVIFPDGTKKELYPPKRIYKHWGIDSNQTVTIKKGLWGFDVVQW